MGNGNGWKVAFLLFSILVSITLTWTVAISGDGKKRDEHITAAEENIRTIHYEAQIQRGILKKIAEAVGADADDAPDVRPLREVK